MANAATSASATRNNCPARCANSRTFLLEARVRVDGVGASSGATPSSVAATARSDSSEVAPARGVAEPSRIALPEHASPLSRGPLGLNHRKLLWQSARQQMRAALG